MRCHAVPLRGTGRRSTSRRLEALALLAVTACGKPGKPEAANAPVVTILPPAPHAEASSAPAITAPPPVPSPDASPPSASPSARPADHGARSSVAIGSVQATGGVVSNVNRVVAGMRAGFRACHNRALAQHPDVEGHLQVTLKLGKGGEVQSANATVAGNVPQSVVKCIEARASAAQFDAPQGDSATVTVSLALVRQ